MQSSGPTFPNTCTADAVAVRRKRHEPTRPGRFGLRPGAAGNGLRRRSPLRPNWVHNQASSSQQIAAGRRPAIPSSSRPGCCKDLHRRFAGPPKLIIDLAQAGNASRSGVPFCLSENRWSNRQLGTSLLDAIYLELHALAEMTAVTETGS